MPRWDMNIRNAHRGGGCAGARQKWWHEVTESFRWRIAFTRVVYTRDVCINVRCINRNAQYSAAGLRAGGG